MSSSSSTTQRSTEPTGEANSANGSPASNSNSLTPWIYRLARGWWGLKEADKAMQVAKDQRRQLVLERLMKKQQDGTIGKPTNEPWPDWEDMNVANDTTTNNVHHHYPSPGGRLLGPLVGGLLGAAAIGGPLLTWLLMRQPEQPQPDTDTDTAFVVDVGKEPIGE